MSKFLQASAIAIALSAAGTATASGIPVIDVANLAQSLQQVMAWGQQYSQMVEQINQLNHQLEQARATYNSLNGVRGMASLANNPTLRYYLPAEWNQTMSLLSSPGHYSGISGNIDAIRKAARIATLDDTGLGPETDAGRAFVASQNQAAMNRALGEAGYRAASDRMAAIQTLLDKVNDAPDQKDILDLQARIHAEQAMVQNENAKLLVMLQLQQAQRDIQQQQAREISMRAFRSTTGPARF
jgi:type IV secretion system protein VirB5